jgi:hypothetical protein
MRLGWIGGAVLAVALFALPASALASTKPDPSAPDCHLGTATVVAGTPLELSGTTNGSGELVGIMASREGGGYREGNVFMADGRWRAVLEFGVRDAGLWAIDLTVDGRDCVSQVTVVLAAGMVAPPPVASADEDLGGPDRGISEGTILAAAAGTAALVVLASWLFLAALAVASIAGSRPLAHRRLRTVARPAAFVAALGGSLTVGLIVYVGQSMSHFDMGIPPEEVVVLNLGLVGAALVGAVLGVKAARRVPAGPPREA